MRVDWTVNKLPYPRVQFNSLIHALHIRSSFFLFIQPTTPKHKQNFPPRELNSHNQSKKEKKKKKNRVKRAEQKTLAL